MLDQVVEFIFSALLGLVLLVVVLVLARRNMVKEMKRQAEKEPHIHEKGEKESRGLGGGPDQS